MRRNDYLYLAWTDVLGLIKYVAITSPLLLFGLLFDWLTLDVLGPMHLQFGLMLVLW